MVSMNTKNNSNVMLSDLFNVDKLSDHLDNNMVTKRDHLIHDLSVFNYSPNAEFSRLWDDVTLKTRGLIANSENRVIARAYDKFFNLGQLVSDGRELDFNVEGTIMSKEDGSLGIAFKYNNEWIVSTRGSFNSEAAIHATKLMRKKYNDTPYNGHSLLVEIVFPKNRIVQDYNGLDDLILLGGMTNNGLWVHPDNIEYTGARATITRGTLNDVINLPDPNDTSEGFVFRYDNGLMVKIKHDSYLELHKAKFNLTPKKVFKHLQNETFDDFVKNLPDEFQDNALEFKNSIMDKFNMEKEIILDLVSEVPENLNRKDTVNFINNNVGNKYAGFVIRKFYGQDINDSLLRKIGWD